MMLNFFREAKLDVLVEVDYCFLGALHTGNVHIQLGENSKTTSDFCFSLPSNRNFAGESPKREFDINQ